MKPMVQGGEFSNVQRNYIFKLNIVHGKVDKTDVYILWLGKMEYNGTYGKPHNKA
jgi:hypothetical protein